MMNFKPDDWLLSRSFRSCGFEGNTVDEHIVWKRKTKQKLYEIIGRPEENTPIEIKSLGETEKNGFVMTKAALLTFPKTYMPMYIIKPRDGSGIPAIALHGHGCGGKDGLAGMSEGLSENIKKFNYTYAFGLAERGYTVYVPDLCGCGERNCKNIAKTSCDKLSFAAMALGYSLAGMIVYELKKLVDYIKTLSDKPVKCCGFSGGGLYTLWLAALDERIETAAVSGYYHSFRDTALSSNFCGCNFAPGLWKYIDCCDLGIMTAPRRLAVETGDNDRLNGRRGIEGAKEQAEKTKKVYEMYNSDDFKFFIGHGGHKWYGMTYDFIGGKI